MKLISPLIIAIVFLLSACDNNKKTGNQTIVATAGDTKEEISALQKKLDALQQLTPYTDDKMQSLIPVQVGNDSAIDISAHSSMGTGFASADYKLSDSTSFELSVFDCGGSAGAGIYNAQFAGLLDTQSESDDEYTKVIAYKGDKAIEHADKRRNNSSFTYIANDRLLVTLEGKNVRVEELKRIAGRVQLK